MGDRAPMEPRLTASSPRPAIEQCGEERMPERSPAPPNVAGKYTFGPGERERGPAKRPLVEPKPVGISLLLLLLLLLLSPFFVSKRFVTCKKKTKKKPGDLIKSRVPRQNRAKTVPKPCENMRAHGFGTVLAASSPILDNPEGRPHRGDVSVSTF
jgi:hypothetical protein